jgi:hypothetical protein
MLPDESEIAAAENLPASQIPVERMIQLAHELLDGGYRELSRRAFAVADIPLRCSRVQTALEN